MSCGVNNFKLLLLSHYYCADINDIDYELSISNVPDPALDAQGAAGSKVPWLFLPLTLLVSG